MEIMPTDLGLQIAVGDGANAAAKAPAEKAAVETALPYMPSQRPEREFVRFTRLQRALHACMIVSFLGLALTGLSLKFSYTHWAATLSHLLGGFQTAGFIHRTAALLMFGVFITHLYSLIQLKKREHK